MSQSRVLRACFVALLSFAGSVWAAAPFSLTPTFDCPIGNDPQLGPNTADSNGDGMHVRDRSPRCRYVV
jgi:hypothetical protein